MKKLGIVLVCLVLIGCAPKQDNPVVYWDQTPTQRVLAASAHARDINGIALNVLPTGSMEPFLTGGDEVVVDTHSKWVDIRPGQLIVYKAIWSITPILHRTAAKSGDNWIVSGDANSRYEKGDLSISQTQFIGKVVAVYTTRKNPNK